MPQSLIWLIAIVAVAAASAPREPVLKQIRLPHAYYYREMYVPQVTSGPSSATWSPDGQELIYSMQGSLWRQRVGSVEATQLTSGDGYDYQPDWSRDGRYVVYASYRSDAIELWLLDLTTGATRSIVANSAVNVDPRWSPDSSRLAFVSTAHEGRWHVFIAPMHEGQIGAPARVTEDHDSGLPRYYYSVWDHYLSPSWSPDGRELTFVSNRGHVWGTGGVWRMAAGPGAAAREIHDEETTWKARPDWSPDGKRVVYSSYLGRQWNQLWLVPANGGDAFQLTYGDFDATAPRWSPDGSRIAFVSNQDGTTSLWVLTVAGGSRARVDATKRLYHTPVGSLRLRVLDGSRTAIPARISVFDASGKSYAPDDAWRHADEAFVRTERRFEYGYFHANGAATLTLPAGQYIVEASHGPEFAIARLEVRVEPDHSTEQDLVLERLDDMPARGWWSGDLHVHMNYGGTYRNTPAHLKFQARAEDLHVVENLIVNKEQRIPDISYFQTTADAVSDSQFLLMHTEEFHTSFWGHTALLGLTQHFLLPNYSGYANTAASSLVPTNSDVFDLAHAQGGLTAYAHPFDAKPDPLDVKESRALPIDAALGKLDYLEVMGFSDHLITSEILVPASQLRLSHSGRRRHGCVSEFCVASRACRPGSRLRAAWRAARSRRVSHRHPPGPNIRDKWTAARVRIGERASNRRSRPVNADRPWRRPQTERRTTPAAGTGLTDVAHPGRSPRDRPERGCRHVHSTSGRPQARACGRAARRRSQRLVHRPRVRRWTARARPGSLPVCEHQPDLRDRRRSAGALAGRRRVLSGVDRQGLRADRGSHRMEYSRRAERRPGADRESTCRIPAPSLKVFEPACCCRR